MYWSPDGKHAIVVAEAFKRLDFRNPDDLGRRVRDPDAQVQGHQPRRFLDRRQVRAVHLRVRRRHHEDRPRQPHRGRHDQAQPILRSARCAGGASPSPAGSRRRSPTRPARRNDLHHARHAAGRARFTRRQAVLRRRHDGRRRACGRRRSVQAGRLHPHRRRHARPVPEPRRQAALCREPRRQHGLRSRRRAKAACR